MAGRRFKLTPIADTSDRFREFAPYVPSIDARGRVAFQASLTAGGSGIFLESEGSVTDLALTGDLVAAFRSHPDLSGDGSWCAYADLRSGEEAVVFGQAGHVAAIADTRRSFDRIGPLGPTMNNDRVVAFRAEAGSGPGIFKSDGGSMVALADSRRFAAFHGLPVINRSGRVVFRADLKSGGQVIIADDQGVQATLAETSGVFAELGRFPCVNDAGTVAFSATLQDGGGGVFLASGGEVTHAVDTASGFESVRGALLDDEGGVLFFATPRGGFLGIYDAAAHRILSIGDDLFGSAVADFALNPVSINGVGQFALRLKLANQRELIVRGDPAS
jgi:hypothetical protein